MKKTLAPAALALPACSRGSDTDDATLPPPALTNDDFSSAQENAGAPDDTGVAGKSPDDAGAGNTL